MRKIYRLVTICLISIFVLSACGSVKRRTENVEKLTTTRSELRTKDNTKIYEVEVIRTFFHDTIKEERIRYIRTDVNVATSDSTTTEEKVKDAISSEEVPTNVVPTSTPIKGANHLIIILVFITLVIVLIVIFLRIR